jgi:hypothetical protein
LVFLAEGQADPRRKHLGFIADHAIRITEKSKGNGKPINLRIKTEELRTEMPSKSLSVLSVHMEFSVIPKYTVTISPSSPDLLRLLGTGWGGPALAYFFVTATFIRIICPG